MINAFKLTIFFFPICTHFEMFLSLFPLKTNKFFFGMKISIMKNLENTIK